MHFTSILTVTVWNPSMCMIFLFYDFLFYFQFFCYLSILSARAWVDGFLMSYPLWLEIFPYTYVFVQWVYMLVIQKAKTQDWIRGSLDLWFYGLHINLFWLDPLSSVNLLLESWTWKMMQQLVQILEVGFKPIWEDFIRLQVKPCTIQSPISRPNLYDNIKITLKKITLDVLICCWILQH